MSAAAISLSYEDVVCGDCLCALIVPAQALDEPGYIKGVSAAGSSSKHEFHALAQTAYYQFQDDELKVELTSAPLEVAGGDLHEVLKSGMVIYRDGQGSIRAVAHQELNLRKLLEAANRFCTRWVRLDI
jgi:hypothetical protein